MAQFDCILEERLKKDIEFDNLVESVDGIETIDILSNNQDSDEFGDPEDDMSFAGNYTPVERNDEDE